MARTSMVRHMQLTDRDRPPHRELSPHRLVRLSPEEWLSEEARALRDEAGKAAHKRISLSEEEAQVS